MTMQIPGKSEFRNKAGSTINREQLFSSIKGFFVELIHFEKAGVKNSATANKMCQGKELEDIDDPFTKTGSNMHGLEQTMRYLLPNGLRTDIIGSVYDWLDEYTDKGEKNYQI